MNQMTGVNKFRMPSSLMEMSWFGGGVEGGERAFVDGGSELGDQFTVRKKIGDHRAKVASRHARVFAIGGRIDHG